MRTMAKPDIRVERFKQELRRRLFETAPGFYTAPLKVAFSLTVFTAACLAVLVALFVARPSVPAKLNSFFRQQEMAAPRGIALNEPNPTGTDMDSPYLREMLRGEIVPAESDLAFAKDWYSQKYPGRPIQVKALEKETFYAVREFEIEDGRRIVVYTQIKNPDSTEPSY